MSTEANKAVVRRMIESRNTGNLAAAEELIAPAHIPRDPTFPELPRGPAGFKQSISTFHRALPDAYRTLAELIAEGDTVVVCWTLHGTHQGDVMGIAPTGNRL